MRNVQRKDLLDFMVDANLYTREKANRFLDRAEYVALYRVPEEEIVSFDKPAIKGQGLLGAGKEYRLIGSDRAAADPIDNYTANMTWMMQRGIRNNALKQTADMMQQLGIGQYYDRPMTDIEKKHTTMLLFTLVAYQKILELTTQMIWQLFQERLLLQDLFGIY